MKLYFLDDDKNILRFMKMIAEDRELGIVCGTSVSAEDALEDLPILRPDIVVVDLLMPKMDGIRFIKTIRPSLPDTAFIMLSQVDSKDMISSAYEAGVEFYIQKPLNAVEVESVIRKVTEQINMRRKLSMVQSLFGAEGGTAGTAADKVPKIRQELSETGKTIRRILKDLGIAGEKGSTDIQTIVEYMVEQEEFLGEITLEKVCGYFTDMPKSMEQRIRRAAAVALNRLAHRGMEDYDDEVFREYAASLFGIEQVRKEMSYIQGKSDRHGNVKIRNFLNNLALHCENR